MILIGITEQDGARLLASRDASGVLNEMDEEEEQGCVKSGRYGNRRTPPIFRCSPAGPWRDGK
ncbi:MAG: hypothetical protein EPN45_08475 [Rhizobiaceae bacterium]|nr:MAG: hypothetical protein EPN45_08475 [Rhizobiaceae bacterium]